MVGDTWQAMCPHACQWTCLENGRPVRRGRGSKKERRRKKKKGRKERKKKIDKEKKMRERERKGNLHYDDRNSSDQEVKSEGYTPKGRDSSYFGLFPP